MTMKMIKKGTGSRTMRNAGNETRKVGRHHSEKGGRCSKCKKL
jgi:hypothetical protein